MSLRAHVGIVLVLAATTGPCGSSNSTSPTQPDGPVSATSAPPCPRPTDDRGQPLYQTATGGFIERKTDAGGALFVVIRARESAPNQSYVVTRQVYDAVDGLERGRKVTLFGYVISPVAGANPTYSCIEF